jgi:hypothetical protein
MKKLLLTAILATTALAGSAQARVDLDVNLGGPAYVEPAPVYGYGAPAPYYHRHEIDYRNGRDRHRDRGWHR